MQTIKCVVVGDGAVGKVRSLCPATPLECTLTVAPLRATIPADVSFDLVHDEQVPK